jgi:fructuronate reductase
VKSLGTGYPLITPGDVGTGLVHLGLGAFHRAHQAVYTEDAIAAAGGDWAIAGVAPRSVTVLDALREQGNLYSVTTRSALGDHTRVVGVLSELLHAQSQAAEVVKLIANPGIRVVTLTITEKGYADSAPIPLLLLRALASRCRADAGPLALVSCDNLPSNGKWLHRVITSGADRLADPALRSWIDTQVSFPGTMVDRIVPAVSDDLLGLVARRLGVPDRAAVCGEPYRQWIIEDDFPGGRPAWERAGAVLTTDAGPWERLKLRTLNGVHSAIAYLGALAGHDTIASTLTMPGLPALLTRLIADDIAPTVEPPPGVNVISYGEEVLQRFANPAIGHRTVQVAMDGTQKLPQRVLHTIMERRAAGADPSWATLVVAAWIRFAEGTSDAGAPLPLDDPLAARLHAALEATPDPVDALLGLAEVFPRELADDEVIRASIRRWHTALTTHGAAATVAGAL